MPYCYTVEGEVVTKKDKNVNLVFFKEKFVLGFKDEFKALSIIRKALINDRLKAGKEIGESFRNVRTCYVSEIAGTSAKVENNELLDLLIEATELGCVPENIDNYRGVNKTKAIERAIHTFKTRKIPKEKVQDLGYVD